MALATKCPRCNTSFKVNPDQLKLRKGLVRCGKCQHVFSGIQYLRYVSDSRAAKRKTPRPTAAAPVSPQTVAEDLNTAFFLPETQFAAKAEQTASKSVVGESGSENMATASTGSAKPLSSDADENFGSRQSRRAARPRNQRHRNKGAAETVSVATGGGDRTAFAGTASAWSDSVPAGTIRATAGPHQSNTHQGDTDPSASTDWPEPANAQDPAASADSGPDSNPDTLQANLPDAWRSSAARPQLGDKDPAATPAPAMKGSSPPGSPGIPAEPGVSAVQAGQQGDASIQRTATPRGQQVPLPRSAHQQTGQSAHFSTPESAEPASGAAKGVQTHWLDGVVDDGDSAIADEEDAIDFFGQSSKPVFDFDLPPRGVWLAAGALTMLLALQLALGARDSLAAWFPLTKPVLQSVSNRLGLTVELPLQPDAIRIESHDLANAPGAEGSTATHVLNLLIRNHANMVLRWPAIELTLTDRTGANILIRKALMPADYLSGNTLATTGMPALSEKAVRLNLRVKEDILIHGYSAVLFYP